MQWCWLTDWSNDADQNQTANTDPKKLDSALPWNLDLCLLDSQIRSKLDQALIALHYLSTDGETRPYILLKFRFLWWFLVDLKPCVIWKTCQTSWIVPGCLACMFCLVFMVDICRTHRVPTLGSTLSRWHPLHLGIAQIAIGPPHHHHHRLPTPHPIDPLDLHKHVHFLGGIKTGKSGNGWLPLIISLFFSACQKSLGKYSKEVGFGEPPPPLKWKNSHIF